MSWLAALLSLLLWAAPAWAVRPLDPAAGVVEVLQMPVSAGQRQCWRQAEEAHWEPWLEQQDGYRGRELLWDPERQQAVVLVLMLNIHLKMILVLMKFLEMSFLLVVQE